MDEPIDLSLFDNIWYILFPGGTIVAVSHTAIRQPFQSYGYAYMQTGRIDKPCVSLCLLKGEERYEKQITQILHYVDGAVNSKRKPE